MSTPPTNPNGAQIETYSVKTIPFWNTCPDSWFFTLEAQFELARVTVSKTKYFMALSMLDQRTIQLCQDIIRSPSDTDPYEHLKGTIISRLVESDDSRLQKLLRDLELGDRKPSQLLIEMKQLAGSNFKDDILRKLWLQRLPNQMQAILTVSSESLDKIALMADRIINTYAYNQVNEIQGNTANPISNLENKIDVLSQRFDKIRRSRSSDRKQTNRSRSKSKTKLDNGICWYHKKFRQRATKCTKPCTYSENENSKN